MRNLRYNIRGIITAVIAVMTLVLGAVCFFVLPDEVAVQWSLSGEVRNTLPKAAAVLCAFAVTAICLFAAWRRIMSEGEGTMRRESVANSIYLSLGLLGALVLIIILVMN